VGPVAQLLGGSDFSFVIGLVVSGGLYLIFARTIDHAAEEKARAASDAMLEAPQR
jgi:NCS1 family nucleobase:cation symporter-1